MRILSVFLLVCVIHGSQAWWSAKKEKQEKCFGELGCFRKDGDFSDDSSRPESVFPEGRGDINTKFQLFTRANQMDGKVLAADNSQLLQDSGFSASKLTKVIVHGFTGTGAEPWMWTLKDTLLTYEDYNVILCDWGDGATTPYFQAVANARVAGAEIGLLINYLISDASASAGDFHVIGFSLGAHVAGYAGERVTDLGRISGLDPASPYFEYTGASVRLDPTDAAFVDVIHTDSESTIIGVLFGNSGAGLGMAQTCGHMDFYPNGGENQPGCATASEEDLIDMLSCDHVEAPELFRASIIDCTAFNSKPCTSWVDYQNGQCSDCGSDGCGVMGFHADQAKPAAGVTESKQYLETSGPPEYCAENTGFQDISLVLNFGSPQSWSESGKVTVTLTSSTGNSVELKLSDDFVTLQDGQSETMTGTLGGSIADVTEAEVTWELEYQWWNPFTWWPAGYYIYIDTMSLTSDQEAGTTVLFCVGNQALEVDVPMTLASAASCKK